MIKQKLKRVSLRMLLLLATILAVSQASWAGTAYLKSSFFSNWDDKGIEITSDQNVFTYEFTPGTTKNYYFRYWADSHVGAYSDNENIDVNGDPVNVNTSSEKSWQLYAEVGKKYTITYNKNTDKLSVTSATIEYELFGSFNSWDSGIDFEAVSGSSDTYTCTINNYVNGDDGFKVVYNGKWCGRDGVTLSNGDSTPLSDNAGNPINIDGANGKDVTFTLKVGTNGVPASISVSWPEGPVTPPTFKINWEGGNTDVAPTESESAPYEYSVTLTDYNSGNWLRIKDDKDNNFGPSSDITKTVSEVSSISMDKGSLKVLRVNTDGKSGDLTLNFTYDASGNVTITSASFQEKMEEMKDSYEVKIYGKLNGKEDWSNTLYEFTEVEGDPNTKIYSCKVTPHTSNGSTDIRFRLKIDGKDYRSTDTGSVGLFEGGGEGSWDGKVKFITKNRLQLLSSDSHGDNCWGIRNLSNYQNITVYVDAYNKQMWVTYDNKPCPYPDLRIYGNFDDINEFDEDFKRGSYEPLDDGSNVQVFEIGPEKDIKLKTSGAYQFAFITDDSVENLLVPSDSREATLNGVPYKVMAVDDFNADFNTFNYTFDKRYNYKITVDGTNVKVEELPFAKNEHDVWISGLDGTLGKGNLTNAVWDDGLQRYVANYICSKVSTINGNAAVSFRVRIDDVFYTCEAQSPTNIPLGSYEDLYQGTKGNYWFYACKGASYRIIVDVPDNGDPRVRVEQNRCNHEGAPHLVVALTGLAEDWSAYDVIVANQIDENTHTYTHTATDNTMTFRVRLSGREYTPGSKLNITDLLGQEFEIGPDVHGLVPEDMIGKPEEEQTQYYLVNSTPGVRYQFTVRAEYVAPEGETKGVNKYYLKVEALGLPPLTKWGIPVVPARINDRTSQEEWAKLTADKPAVYLLAEVLNGNHPNPEWEMILGEDGLYHLDHFVMRDTELAWKGTEEKNDIENRTGAHPSVRIFTSVTDKNGVTKDFDKFKPTYGNDWDNEKCLTPGMLYNATYNLATNELTFTADNAKYTYKDGTTTYTAPPFIGLVGNELKPLDLSNDETPREGSTHANSAWQESWILYDADGNVVLDTKNKVLYSTNFPQPNPSYFNMEINDKVIEVRASNIRLTVQSEGEGDNVKMVVKTGAEWKAELENDPAYDYLRTARSNADGVTALNDDDLYARYVVENVWILGVNKLWSGWTGSNVSDGAANWLNHINWGFGGEKDDNGTPVDINTAYKLAGNGGNFNFGEPQYFKTLELFYNLQHHNTNNTVENQVQSAKNYSVIYTTQGYGQPSINARSVKNEHKIATVELKIADMPENASVLDFKVRRLNSTNDKYCSKTGAAVADPDEAIIITKPANISEITKNDINSQFNNVYKFDQTVTQDAGLARGKYYYELEVTFLVPSADGQSYEERVEKVQSAIVTIYNTNVYTRPRAYQLIRNYDESIKDPDGNTYKYITFSSKSDNVFGCQFELSNPATSYLGTFSYEPITSFTEETLKKYYLDPAKCAWTNKVLIFCELPTEFKNLTEGTDYEFVNYTLNEIDDVDVLFAQKIRRYKADGTGTAKYAYADKSYAAVVVFPGIETHTFSVIPNYYNRDTQGGLTLGEYTALPQYFNYTYPVPDFESVEFNVTSAPISGTMVITDENGVTKNITEKEVEHVMSAKIHMTGFNIEEDENYPGICTDIFKTVYPYFVAKIRMDHGKVEGTETPFYLKGANPNLTTTDFVHNDIVLNGLDPADWLELKNGKWVAKEDNFFNYDINFPGEKINAYPNEPGWSRIQMKPDVVIEAPNHMGTKPSVYRKFVQFVDENGDDNHFKQQLVLRTHAIDKDKHQNTFGVDGLTLHDDMHIALTKDGKYLQPLDNDYSSLVRLSAVNDTEDICILEESPDFTWYAGMYSDNRVGLNEMNLGVSYAYFFKTAKTYSGIGAITFNENYAPENPLETPANAPRKVRRSTDSVSYAAPRRKANSDDTHTMVLSPATSQRVALSDIVTSVDEIEHEIPVIAGKGWLEVNADEAVVYNTNGIAVAGAGRSELPAGIYMVRVAGSTYKVVVK